MMGWGGPQIENPKGLALPPAAEALLGRLFPAYRRVIIKTELGSGLSGSRVFWVCPVGDAPALPVAVKMGAPNLIEKEYQAYQDYICDRLPGAAEIRSKPVLLSADEGGVGGLCYYLVGSGIFGIESLNTYCRRADPQDIWHVLEKRLFKRMGLLWRFSDACPHFNFGSSYDHLLPVNLVVEPGQLPPGVSPYLLRPSPDFTQYAPPDQGAVRLEGFVVTEIDPAQHAITLNAPFPMASYRVRLQPVENTLLYQAGDTLDVVEGTVTATRLDLLQAQIQQALGYVGSCELPITLDSGNRVHLPDPLAALPDILAGSHHVRVACLHGDMNLENILVDPDARDVHLIDFTLARRDHVLHDLLRLETGIVTWLLPDMLTQAGLPAETICRLYEQLHSAADRLADPAFLSRRFPYKPALMLAAVRKMARECLHDAEDWREYYQGLTLYLFGALKFKNLDSDPCAPLPKRVAFWGAAMAQHLAQTPSPEAKMFVASVELPPFVAGPPITHARQFFGRQRELGRLFDLCKRAPLQNAAIIGPRRSGKTSLLLHLKNITTASPAQLRPGQRADWLAYPQRYRWVYVDFQDARMGKRTELLRHLLAGMELPPPDSCELERFMDVVSERLRAPTIILLDEIDVALQRYPELDNSFWESLRSLATNQVEGNLAFVLAAHSSPDVLAHYSNIGSPFFNIFGYTVRLGPLTEPEARELIGASPLAFPPADVEWILAHSGRWPILVQILCRERFVALESGEPGDAWRQEALEQVAPFQHLMG